MIGSEAPLVLAWEAISGRVIGSVAGSVTLLVLGWVVVSGTVIGRGAPPS